MKKTMMMLLCVLGVGNAGAAEWWQGKDTDHFVLAVNSPDIAGSGPITVKINAAATEQLQANIWQTELIVNRLNNQNIKSSRIIRRYHCGTTQANTVGFAVFKEFDAKGGLADPDVQYSYSPNAWYSVAQDPMFITYDFFILNVLCSLGV